MQKALISMVLSLVVLSLSVGQTVALAFHAESSEFSRAVAEEIQTGALDRLYSSGLIVTTTGSVKPGLPLDLPALLVESKLGLVEWILLLDVTGEASSMDKGLPTSIDFQLIRVRDGNSTVKGSAQCPPATAPGFTDPDHRLRSMGDAAAKAALVALGRQALDFGGGGVRLSLNGGW